MNDSDKLNLILQNLKTLDGRFVTLDKKVDTLDEKVHTLDQKFVTLDKKVDTLDGKINTLDEKVNILEYRTKNMEVHLENVTDKNIRFIAENYCTLTRKLDDNNKITDTQLAYQVKVNYLSSDVEKLKKDVAELKSRIA